MTASLIAFLTAPATLCSLGLAAVAGLLGSMSERRFARPQLSAWIVVVGFWIGMATTQWLLTKLPSGFDLKSLFPNQLWERLLWPALAIVVVAQLVRRASNTNSAVQSLTSVSLAAIGILVALPFAPNWTEFVPENAGWSVAVALSVGWNVWALEAMVERGAERWVFGIVIAQLGTIAAILLSAYATLGNWCVCLMIMCAVLGIIRSIQPHGEWIRALFLPSLFVACGLIPMIRFYSSQALGPGWYGYLLLIPFMIAAIDWFLGQRLGSRGRVVVSVGSAALLASIAIGLVWGTGEGH